MKAPDKIFLNRRHPEPYWFKDKQLDSDVEYIRKDALLEWAKERREAVANQNTRKHCARRLQSYAVAARRRDTIPAKPEIPKARFFR